MDENGAEIYLNQLKKLKIMHLSYSEFKKFSSNYSERFISSGSLIK